MSIQRTFVVNTGRANFVEGLAEYVNALPALEYGNRRICFQRLVWSRDGRTATVAGATIITDTVIDGAGASRTVDRLVDFLGETSAGRFRFTLRELSPCRTKVVAECLGQGPLHDVFFALLEKLAGDWPEARHDMGLGVPIFQLTYKVSMAYKGSVEPRQRARRVWLEQRIKTRSITPEEYENPQVDPDSLVLVFEDIVNGVEFTKENGETARGPYFGYKLKARLYPADGDIAIMCGGLPLLLLDGSWYDENSEATFDELVERVAMRNKSCGIKPPPNFEQLVRQQRQAETRFISRQVDNEAAVMQNRVAEIENRATAKVRTLEVEKMNLMTKALEIKVNEVRAVQENRDLMHTPHRDRYPKDIRDHLLAKGIEITIRTINYHLGQLQDKDKIKGQASKNANWKLDIDEFKIACAYIEREHRKRQSHGDRQ